MVIVRACVTQIQRLISIQGSSPSKGVCDSIDDIGRPGQTSIFWGLISDGLLRYGTHCVPASDVANLYIRCILNVCDQQIERRP